VRTKGAAAYAACAHAAIQTMRRSSDNDFALCFATAHTCPCYVGAAEAVEGAIYAEQAGAGAPVRSHARLTSTTQERARGRVSSTLRLPGDPLQRDYDIARIDLLLCRRAFFGDLMGCRVRLYHCDLGRVLAVAPATRRAVGEAQRHWLTQAATRSCASANCGGGIFGVVVGEGPDRPRHGKPSSR